MSSSTLSPARAGRSAAGRRRAAWMTVFALVLIGLAAVIWTVAGYGSLERLWGVNTSAPPPAPAAVEPRALGRIEPAGDVIDIAAVMGERLVRLAVKEGDAVKEGQPLADLDSHALRQLDVEASEGQIREAQARLAAEVAVADARIATAKLALEQARTRDSDLKVEELKLPVLERAWQIAKKNRERMGKLSDRLVSDAERDEQSVAVDKAKAEWEAAKMLLDKGRRRNEIGLQAAQADLTAARAAKQVTISSIPLESLRKKAELARAQWERSVLRAPGDGTVLKVFLRPGELVGTTPIMQIANLNRMVVVAQVYETDVKRIHPGQAATVTSKSFPAPYDERGLQGKVTRIGRLIAQPSMKDLNPLAQSDRRAVDVRIELDKPGSEQARNFVHMQVDVAFGPP
jgi:HlyD family secretion protein